MTVNDYLANSLQQTLDLLKMHLEDMSDAELMMRPVPAANHANWQIGHMIVSETELMRSIGASMPELPAGFGACYAKDKVKEDDPSKFASKAELLALFDKTRAATIAYARTLSDARLSTPSPMPEYFPTIADFAGEGALHICMHCGHIQVLRRMLGKPVLF